MKMELRQWLENDLREAMRSGDELRKRTIRLALSSIKLAEIDQGAVMDDNRVLAILHKEIKARHELIEGAQQARRQDLIDEAKIEIKILDEYLPKQLTDDELVAMAREVIQEMRASSMTDMGIVMKNLLPKIQGRAPNNKVSQVVKELLNA